MNEGLSVSFRRGKPDSSLDSGLCGLCGILIHHWEENQVIKVILMSITYLLCGILPPQGTTAWKCALAWEEALGLRLNDPCPEKQSLWKLSTLNYVHLCWGTVYLYGHGVSAVSSDFPLVPVTPCVTGTNSWHPQHNGGEFILTHVYSLWSGGSKAE